MKVKQSIAALIIILTGLLSSVHGERGLLFPQPEPGESSACLIMDSSTGKILYRGGKTSLLSGIYPPGSIAKPWAAAVFLENRGTFVPDSTIECYGKYYPPSEKVFLPADSRLFNLPADPSGKKYFKCPVAQGHGNTDLRDAIVKSCNVFFLRCSTRSPGEFYAKLCAGWSLSSSVPVSAEKPTHLMLAASAIGEGGLIQTTPAEAAARYAAFYNGGNIPLPFCTPCTRISLKSAPFRMTTLSLIRGFLAETVEKGTLAGIGAGLASIKILGGKTGTATILGNRYKTHGWNIIAFKVPSIPSVLILVSFTERGTGSGNTKKVSEIVLKKIDTGAINLAK